MATSSAANSDSASTGASTTQTKPASKLSPSRLPILGTILAFALVLGLFAFRHWDVFTVDVMINLISDNAFLGVAAIGMTFVILSGGIDLSVGSMIGFAGVALATLVETKGTAPGLSIGLILAFGALFGGITGALIAYFDIAPFLATLGGMFLLRGLALVVSLESLSLANANLVWASGARLPIPATNGLPLNAIVFIALLLLAVVLASFTVFGRYVHAVGDNADSASLLGLPVFRTKIGVYALSGFCSALAGVLYALYTSSGNASAAQGLELDAIAAVVIGGTLLTGGHGTVVGTVLGVLILGTVQMLITFDGTLNSWWSRIITGILLLMFIILQRFSTQRKAVI